MPPVTDLDNPFHSALRTIHRGIALEAGGVLRYPAEYAPFLGVAEPGADATAALEALVAPGESVYLLGDAPDVPQGWKLDAFRPLAQMIRDEPIEVFDGPEIVELTTDRHRADVLELTALVYPHYFRERTIEMGRYYGIYEDGRLAAMIGERLGTREFREMSAICTHPDFTGRGYARRLTAWLGNRELVHGIVPFLHVSYENPRAKSLYEHMGYRLRRDIPFWSLSRGS